MRDEHRINQRRLDQLLEHGLRDFEVLVFLPDLRAQFNGAFAAFNRAYKTYRQQAKARGESVQPYWAVMTDLRGVIIRALIANKNIRLDAAAVLAEIRKQFPWLARTVHNGRRKREKPNR